MKNTILLMTALSVSLDSFFCGLSMSVKTKKNFKFLLGISLSVLILCFLGSTLGQKMQNLLIDFSELLGGLILLFISLLGFLEKEEKTLLINEKDSVFLESLIIGFAIGLDGAMGSLSLSLMDYNIIIVPLLITGVHVLLMNFAIIISSSKVATPLKKLKSTPYIILFLLGTYKIISSI